MSSRILVLVLVIVAVAAALFLFDRADDGPASLGWEEQSDRVETAASEAVELVDAAPGDDPSAIGRVEVPVAPASERGVLRWSDLLVPVEHGTGRSIENWYVLHIDTDGVLSRFEPDDVATEAALDKRQLAALDGPDHARRLFLPNEVEVDASDPQRVELARAARIEVVAPEGSPDPMRYFRVVVAPRDAFFDPRVGPLNVFFSSLRSRALQDAHVAPRLFAEDLDDVARDRAATRLRRSRELKAHFLLDGPPTFAFSFPDDQESIRRLPLLVDELPASTTLSVDLYSERELEVADGDAHVRFGEVAGVVGLELRNGTQQPAWLYRGEIDVPESGVLHVEVEFEPFGGVIGILPEAVTPTLAELFPVHAGEVYRLGAPHPELLRAGGPLRWDGLRPGPYRAVVEWLDSRGALVHFERDVEVVDRTFASLDPIEVLGGHTLTIVPRFELATGGPLPKTLLDMERVTAGATLWASGDRHPRSARHFEGGGPIAFSGLQPGAYEYRVHAQVAGVRNANVVHLDVPGERTVVHLDSDAQFEVPITVRPQCALEITTRTPLDLPPATEPWPVFVTAIRTDLGGLESTHLEVSEENGIVLGRGSILLDEGTWELHLRQYHIGEAGEVTFLAAVAVLDCSAETTSLNVPLEHGVEVNGSVDMVFEPDDARRSSIRVVPASYPDREHRSDDWDAWVDKEAGTFSFRGLAPFTTYRFERIERTFTTGAPGSTLELEP